MARLINLTPHPLTFRLADGTAYILPPSGQIARVTETTEDAGYLNVSDTVRLPLVRLTYGKPEGLPDPEPGVFYVVSRVVLAAVDRPDLLAPGDYLRDADGNIRGCKSLVWKGE